MNGKIKKNKILVLDSGKVSHYLRRDLGPNHFNMYIFLLLKFNIYNLHFLERN